MVPDGRTEWRDWWPFSKQAHPWDDQTGIIRPSTDVSAIPGERDALDRFHRHAAPLDILWQARAIVAIILAGQGLALLLALAPGVQGDRWVLFGLASLVVQWVALLTLLGLFLLRHLVRHLPPITVAWVALALLLMATSLVGGAGLWFFPSLAGAQGQGPAMLQLTLLALTVGLMGLAAFHTHWRNRNLAARAARAELEALQARIRPHFLFNTLNTGAALVHDKPEAAEDLLLDLADLFRAALSGPELIDLADELELARRYLHIEQLRFGDRLRVRWEVPEVLPEVKLPTLSLQPLVENAVRHGVEPCAEGGELLLQVAVGRRTVQVLVQNPVARHAPRKRNGHSIGLTSVRARIAALTDGRSRLEVLPGEGVYRVAIVVPLE